MVSGYNYCKHNRSPIKGRSNDSEKLCHADVARTVTNVFVIIRYAKKDALDFLKGILFFFSVPLIATSINVTANNKNYPLLK